nr:putative ribonuclease H-like domain-containing protein [Tanacetum cinerariifolium]
SDYAGASLDRKSTTGGCQFLGCRLISGQCKNQTVVATSSTKAEYVAAVSDSKDEFEGEPMPTQKEPSFVQPTKHVKTPRTSVKPVEHPKQAANLRKDIPKSRGHKHS